MKSEIGWQRETWPCCQLAPTFGHTRIVLQDEGGIVKHLRRCKILSHLFYLCRNVYSTRLINYQTQREEGTGEL